MKIKFACRKHSGNSSAVNDSKQQMEKITEAKFSAQLSKFYHEQEQKLRDSENLLTLLTLLF